MVAELEEPAAAQGFEIWPINMPILDAFLAVATQWRTTSLMDGRTIYQALDYAGVRAGLAQARLRLTPAQWSRFQVMERAAADALNGVRG